MQAKTSSRRLRLFKLVFAMLQCQCCSQWLSPSVGPPISSSLRYYRQSSREKAEMEVDREAGKLQRDVSRIKNLDIVDMR